MYVKANAQRGRDEEGANTTSTYPLRRRDDLEEDTRPRREIHKLRAVSIEIIDDGHYIIVVDLSVSLGVAWTRRNHP
jgi:hypothetical protein